MRLSADREDPGWHEAHRKGINLNYVLILCGGDFLRHIVTADTDLGFVDVVELNDLGKAVKLAGSIAVRHIHGKVEFRFLAAEDGSWPHVGLPRPEKPIRAEKWRRKVP